MNFNDSGLDETGKSISLEVIFHLGKILVCLLYLGTQTILVVLHLLCERSVGKSHYLYGKDGGIHRTIHSHRGNRYARRHLYDAEHGVHTVEGTTLDRHSDNRKCG